eukprot:TRINITY_DN5760_c0_g1_i11.p1 TRINITY_DN5760_c0_g1~~TRINITY_DN5760_c0_g1_i11.p1  ORF type:complete len:643 (-),score=81.00 TRINITY_DN5760_c0_g1_i11:48-1976(-)
MAWSWLASCLIAGGGVVCVLHEAMILRSAARQLFERPGRRGVLALPTVAGILASLKAAMASTSRVYDEERYQLSQTVATNLERKRQEFVNSLMHWVTQFMALRSFLNIVIFLRDKDMRFLTVEQDILHISIFIILIFWQRCPPLTPATVTFQMCFVMIYITGHSVLVRPTRTAVVASAALHVGPRLVFSTTLMRKWLTVLWNILHVVTVVYTYSRLDDNDTCETMNVSILMIGEMFNTVMIIGISEKVRGDLVRSIWSDIENAETKSGSSAAVALLNTVCDASTELDECLVISDDGARLAAMLLHTSGRSLKGVEFLKLLSSDEDRDTFVRRARARADSQNDKNMLADLFHLHIQDNTNNRIEVEVFLVSFASYFKRTKFLVGIREQAVDVVGPQVEVPVKVSFDVSTFEVTWQSSSFDLRGPTGSCEVGRCLRDWMVRCPENDTFFDELRLASGAVEFSNESFSFTSTLVLRDSVKPGAAHVTGHRFLVVSAVCLSFEDNKFEQIRKSTGGDPAAAIDVANVICDGGTSTVDRCRGDVSTEAAKSSDRLANEANGDVTTSDGLDSGRASTQRRIIACMTLDCFKRIRTKRGRGNRQPEPRPEHTSLPTWSLGRSDRLPSTTDLSDEMGSCICSSDSSRLSI